MEMKKCSKCGIEKLATVEWYHKDKNRKDGLYPYCKKCQTANSAKHYLDNKERRQVQIRRWAENNIGQIKEYKKEYYKKTKTVISERQNKYRLENKEYIKKYNMLYRKENRELLKLQKHNRISSERRLLSTFTLTEWKEVKDYFNHECVYCGKQLKRLEQDHFWPLNKGGEYTKFNIVPSCRSCNASKNNKQFEEWYPMHTSYSLEREIKIYEYFKQLAINNNGWGRKRYDLGIVTIEVII